MLSRIPPFFRGSCLLLVALTIGKKRKDYQVITSTYHVNEHEFLQIFN